MISTCVCVCLSLSQWNFSIHQREIHSSININGIHKCSLLWRHIKVLAQLKSDLGNDSFGQRPSMSNVHLA